MDDSTCSIGSMLAEGSDRGATPLPCTIFFDAVLTVSMEDLDKDDELTAGMVKITGDAKEGGGSHHD